MKNKQNWLEAVSKQIDEYEPHTVWEAANNRWLRRLKQYEKTAVKAIEREEQESKRKRIKERRNQLNPNLFA